MSNETDGHEQTWCITKVDKELGQLLNTTLKFARNSVVSNNYKT